MPEIVSPFNIKACTSWKEGGEAFLSILAYLFVVVCFVSLEKSTFSWEGNGQRPFLFFKGTCQR